MVNNSTNINKTDNHLWSWMDSLDTKKTTANDVCKFGPGFGLFIIFRFYRPILTFHYVVGFFFNRSVVVTWFFKSTPEQMYQRY